MLKYMTWKTETVSSVNEPLQTSRDERRKLTASNGTCQESEDVANNLQAVRLDGRGDDLGRILAIVVVDLKFHIWSVGRPVRARRTARKLTKAPKKT